MKKNKQQPQYVESTEMKLTIYGGSFVVFALVILGAFIYLLVKINQLKAKSTTGNIPQFYNVSYWVLLSIMIVAFVAGIVLLLVGFILYRKKHKKN